MSFFLLLILGKKNKIRSTNGPNLTHHFGRGKIVRDRDYRRRNIVDGYKRRILNNTHLDIKRFVYIL